MTPAVAEMPSNPEKLKSKITSEKVDLCCQLAFHSLVAGAATTGICLYPVMGLQYLSDPNLTVRFRSVCEDIIRALEMSPQI